MSESGQAATSSHTHGISPRVGPGSADFRGGTSTFGALDSNPSFGSSGNSNIGLEGPDADQGIKLSCCIAKAWAWYVSKLERQPLTAKGLTAGLLSIISEALSRTISGKKVVAQPTAYTKQFFLGLLWRSPLLHFWLCLLNRMFTTWDSKRLKTVLVKIMVHESFYDPFFLTTYMYLLGRLDGRSHRDLIVHVKANFVPAMKWQWKVWPLIQVINFLYIPSQLSVGYIQCVSVIMNALITLRARTKT